MSAEAVGESHAFSWAEDEVIGIEHIEDCCREDEKQKPGKRCENPVLAGTRCNIPAAQHDLKATDNDHEDSEPCGHADDIGHEGLKILIEDIQRIRAERNDRCAPHGFQEIDRRLSAHLQGVESQCNNDADEEPVSDRHDAHECGMRLAGALFSFPFTDSVDVRVVIPPFVRIEFWLKFPQQRLHFGDSLVFKRFSQH